MNIILHCKCEIRHFKLESILTCVWKNDYIMLNYILCDGEEKSTIINLYGIVLFHSVCSKCGHNSDSNNRSGIPYEQYHAELDYNHIPARSGGTVSAGRSNHRKIRS